MLGSRSLHWGLVMVGIFLSSTSLHADEEATMRVMSFNIRYGSAKDGENNWTHRKEFFVETIQAFNPDLLGTQEAEAFQKDDIAAKLPDYGVVGVGREDGKLKGEMTAVFYKKDRFEKLESGHFWLSETPEKIGSKSWDSSLPRMVTWLKLKDRQATGHPTVYFFNTHFDHRGETARQESGKLIQQKIAELGTDAAVILTGDFNASEGSKAYRSVFGEPNGKAMLRDAYRLAHSEANEEEGTFNGFDANVRKGARIDWVGVTDRFKVLGAEINRVSRNGKVPSDHFPIEVVLKYQN